MFDQPPPPSSPSLRRRREVILRRRRIGAAVAVVVVAGLTAFLLVASADPPATQPSGTSEDTTAAPTVGAPAGDETTAPPGDAAAADALVTAGGMERHTSALRHARAELRRLPQAWPIVRGVYATMWTFADERWNELLALVRDTEINAVVVDVKDDAGLVAWKGSDVALARETGADRHGQSKARARARIRSLRQAGGYPIARVVCFKDDVAASGRPSLAIASAGGGVWRDDRGNAWLDPNARSNWDYLVDLGREAARLGFLEVQFDYVRFPTDGPTDTAVYRSGGGVDPTSIRAFLAYARERLHVAGVRISADVFGLTTYKPQAAGDGDGTGQRFEDVVSEVDYVSPMVYPSHYYPGNYGLANPESQPYAVVANAMREARDRVTNQRARVRPWLEDFSLSVPHHPGRVAAQLRATYESGIDGWLLWNAGNRYSAAALDGVLRSKAARDR